MIVHAFVVRAVAVILVGAIGCGGSQRAPLGAAGGENDEGGGELARASRRFQSSSTTQPEAFAEDRSRRYGYYGSEYGGDPYGGDPYGGVPYGGVSYASWRVPQWNYTSPNRTPRYQITGGLASAIEGTVSWQGAVPAKITTPCGTIDNPTLRVTSDKRMRGVIVYIDKVELGRATPYYAKPIGVGGSLAKRGCVMQPAAQIVAPLPASVSIYADAQRTKLRVTPPKVPAVFHELQEAGFAQVEVEPGITKIEDDEGKLAAAWVVGLETPYFAITDDLGHYRIDELAPGTYEVTFWQPPIASLKRDGTWTYGAPIVTKRSVTVGAKTAQLSVTLTGR
jgi:hypothetical protein